MAVYPQRNVVGLSSQISVRYFYTVMVNCSSINYLFHLIIISLLETPIIDKLGKKRSASTFEEDGINVGVG